MVLTLHRRITHKKQKLESGLIGEGFHGKTYRVAGDPYGTGFANLLAGEKILKITFLTMDKKYPLILTKEDDIATFIKFLYNNKGSIAKIFKDQYFLTGVTIIQDFEDEIEANRNVVEYYGRQAKKFLTIAPMEHFMGVEFFGTIIEIEHSSPLYVTYAVMCNNKYNMNPGKFIVEILESIEVLQKADYQHNDIKLDNVVLCEDRYKLIDWGQASKIDTINVGDMISTSPVKWYIKGAPGYFAQKIMNIRTRMVDYEYEKSNIFQETYARIRTEFYGLIHDSPNTSELFETYKKSFDIFMAGMTLLHAVHRFSLNYNTYKPIIEVLTSIKNPITDPKIALKIVQAHLKNLPKTRSKTRKSSRK